MTITPEAVTTPQLTAASDDTAAGQLVRRWLVTKRSPHTRFSYGRDLGVRVTRPGTAPGKPPKPGTSSAPDWLTYCRSIGLDPLGAVQEEHVALWARGMEASGLSPASVARKMSAVSSWYGWLRKHGHVTENPAEDLARPYVDPDASKTPGLTRDQALALLGAADSAEGPQSARNAALVALLLYTGARISEARGATLADLGMDRGHRVLWVTRKGGARQALALPPPVLGRLDTYVAARQDLSHLPALRGEDATRARPLIATYAGARLAPADAWKLLRRLSRKAGLPAELVAHIGPHSMRHSFATLYLDAGGNLRDLQDAMGHKDPRTTRRYDRARGKLDRSPGYTLAAYLADEADSSS
jgi:site-specific recombinase XerD